MVSKVEKTDEQWRDQLTPEQFHVTRRAGTEAPFTGAYNDCKINGTYRCVCCNTPLFLSKDKFDSGTGWPSYVRPIAPDAVKEIKDNSLGMQRVEVTCSACDAHLGHVFPDGPAHETGLRYCINSLSLNMDSDTDV